MRQRKLQWSALALGFALGLGSILAGNATAAPINYGDFVGATVFYRTVTEDSGTDPTPLYGAPEINGDTLDFDPTGFSSDSSGGTAPPDVTDGHLSFEIEARPGHFVDQVRFFEGGDYTLVGNGTDATQVSVSAPVRINITEVDGQNVDPINVNVDIIREIFFLTQHGGTGVFWDGSVTVDVTQELIAQQVDFVNGATRLSVDIDNVLSAQTEQTTTSRIAKKDAQNRGFGVEIVPEPASWQLLALGLLALRARRRTANG